MLKSWYLPDRFFQVYGAFPVLFLISFFFPAGYIPVIIAFGMVLLLTLMDGWLLTVGSRGLQAEREVSRIFSLGETHQIGLRLKNGSGLPLWTIVIDELPVQLQVRDQELLVALPPGQELHTTYPIRPLTRGVYRFGHLNVYLFSRIGLLRRRLQLGKPCEVAVYPSIRQMKRFEFMGLHQLSASGGLKKLRRIGHSYEFDQIRNYLSGDDFRSINWKASGRRGGLMVNQYADERSQQIYCILDKSRLMQQPFEGMSLLDYAVNASLVLSNIALLKHDKAGLLTFSNNLGSVIKADNVPNQLQKILQVLYKEAIREEDADFELLYRATQKLLSGRSLIILFTNFESKHGLERALPLLRSINRTHLLLVILFQNTAITRFVEKPAEQLQDVYHQAIARKYLTDKQEMVQMLQQYGIQAILTEPDKLSPDAINKYLELKSRGFI